MGDSISTLLLWSRLDGGLGLFVSRLRAYPLLAYKGEAGLRGDGEGSWGEPHVCNSR